MSLRDALRNEAAEALAFWIVHVDIEELGHTGLTPEEFVGLVQHPDPIFERVFAELRKSPRFDPNVIRMGKALIREMGQERLAVDMLVDPDPERLSADGTIVDQGKDDYWQILRQDALHENCHEHAQAVGHDWYVLQEFYRQMDAAKNVLLEV